MVALSQRHTSLVVVQSARRPGRESNLLKHLVITVVFATVVRVVASIPMDVVSCTCLRRVARVGQLHARVFVLRVDGPPHHEHILRLDRTVRVPKRLRWPTRDHVQQRHTRRVDSDSKRRDGFVHLCHVSGVRPHNGRRTRHVHEHPHEPLCRRLGWATGCATT